MEQLLEVEEDEPGQREAESLIPGQAYTLAQRFKCLHGNDLSGDLIEQFLAKLNQIWRDRERKHVGRIRQRCSEEVVHLKRQLLSRQPSDIIKAKR